VKSSSLSWFTMLREPGGQRRCDVIGRTSAHVALFSAKTTHRPCRPFTQLVPIGIRDAARPGSRLTKPVCRAADDGGPFARDAAPTVDPEYPVRGWREAFRDCNERPTREVRSAHVSRSRGSRSPNTLAAWCPPTVRRMRSRLGRTSSFERHSLSEGIANLSWPTVPATVGLSDSGHPS
jgi:hypothetical protein